MEDLISRQKAITALRALSDEDGYINVPHEVVTDVVRGLPPVRAEHGQTTQPEQTKTDKLGVKTGETYKDTISRQAAIDAFDCTDELIVSGSANAQNVTNYINKVIGKIKALPPAQPEPQWIPCSERLPETDGEVLITVLDMEEDYVEVYKGFYQDQEWWTQWCHGCLKIKDEPCGENIVTAWMPLPEPYVERRQDE